MPRWHLVSAPCGNQNTRHKVRMFNASHRHSPLFATNFAFLSKSAGQSLLQRQFNPCPYRDFAVSRRA